MATAALVIDTTPSSVLLEVTRNTTQAYTISFDADVRGQTVEFLVKSSTSMLSGGYRIPVPDSAALLSKDSGGNGIVVAADGMSATLTLDPVDCSDATQVPEGRCLVWSLRLVEWAQDVLAGQLICSTSA